MESPRRLNLGLVLGFVVSLHVHVGVAALLFLAGTGASASEPEADRQRAMPPPPDQQDQVQVGAQESRTASIDWLGIAEPEIEHRAPVEAETDQPAIAQVSPGPMEASSGQPTPPSPESPASPQVEADPGPMVPPEVEVAQTEPDPSPEPTEEASETTAEEVIAAAGRERTELESEPTTASADSIELEARPEEIGIESTGEAFVLRPGAPGVGETPTEDETEETLISSAPTEDPGLVTVEPDDGETAEEPTPKPETPDAIAVPRSAATPTAPPPAPERRPANPGSVAGGGEERPVPVEDRESDATARKITELDDWTKPQARPGLEVKTVRPKWTISAGYRWTRRPTAPVVWMEFDRTGRVVRAGFEKQTDGTELRTGNPNIDEALLDAVYRWTATGKELEALGPEGRTRFTVRIRRG